MSPLRLALVFLAALLVALIAMAPLRFVLDAAGGQSRLGFVSAYGSIWQGRVYGVRLGGEPIREVRVSLQPAALLTGALSGRWTLADSRIGGSGDGAIRANGDWMLRDVDAHATLARLGLDRWPGLDPRERVFVQIDRLVVEDGACVQAAGTLRTGALIALARVFDADGPPLVGDLSCDNGRLALDFSGESEDVSVRGRVVFGAQAYDWSAEVETGLADLADALAVAGFEPADGAWIGEGSGRYDGE